MIPSETKTCPHCGAIIAGPFLPPELFTIDAANQVRVLLSILSHKTDYTPTKTIINQMYTYNNRPIWAAEVVYNTVKRANSALQAQNFPYKIEKKYSRGYKLIKLELEPANA